MPYETDSEPDSGLGATLQGDPEPVQITEKRDTYGMRYKATWEEKAKAIKMKQQEKVADLEGRMMEASGPIAVFNGKGRFTEACFDP